MIKVKKWLTFEESELKFLLDILKHQSSIDAHRVKKKVSECYKLVMRDKRRDLQAAIVRCNNQGAKHE